MKTAVYPGTFDPITIGHMDIVRRAATLFDTVYVVIIDHDAKHTLFTADERCRMAQSSLQKIRNVKVAVHRGLTLDFARKVNACALIRGVRQVKDYEYECNQAACNARIHPEIETVLLLSKPEYAFLSSSSVKDFAAYHQDLQGLVSDVVAKALIDKYR